MADGPPLFHGAQLAIDTTLVSPLSRDGLPHPRCVREDGAVLAAARRRKERTYPELTGQFGSARLVVLAGEVGGRWSEETQAFLRQLAKAKARSEPVPQQAILACSSARAFASSLLEVRVGGGCDGPRRLRQTLLGSSATSGPWHEVAPCVR